MDEIWMSACRNVEISDDVARPWYDKIRKKMVQGSGRFYHNWDELLLRKKDYLRDVSPSIVFAVFFQYYEFDGKRNCVEKNCEAFDELCLDAGLKDENLVKLVKKLLGDEKTDGIHVSEADTNLLQDLDLLVLGSPPEDYKRYTEFLRKEYSHLDDNSYKQMRLKPSTSQPSTSRAALATSPISDASLPSDTGKSSPCKKKFVKFKDFNHRKSLLQKYRTISKRKTKSKSSLQSLVIDSMPRKAPQATRKVVSVLRNCSLLNKENNNNEIRTNVSLEGITVSLENVSAPVKEGVPKATITDLDDDCVCIDPPPEVIVVDDESIDNRPSVTCRRTVLRPYEPIGRMRHLNRGKNTSMNILTSTPKPMFFGGASNEFEWRKFLNNPLSPVLFNKKTTKETANNDIVIIDDTIEPTKNTNQSLDNTLKNVHNKKNDVIWIGNSFPSTSSTSAQTANEQNTKSSSQDKTMTATNGPKSANTIADDSVIFVSENIIRDSQPSTAPAFIPLTTPYEESRFRNVPETPQPPTAKRPRHDLFNSREQQQLKIYNENAYNPNQNDPKLQTKKRMVIIDGSNVAYHHALKKAFSVKGLQICLDYFEKIGHEVKAIVPQFRLQRLKSTDPATLEKLHEQGKVIFTPCKNLPGKSSTSYDDRFILQLAAELDAAVVSNDNYRDLIHENAAFKKIIENRVIGYTWCNDLFILPKDPYGKWGPSLSDILNRS